MCSSNCVYHDCCGVERGANGPFAFTLRCQGCEPATLDATVPGHLPKCDRNVGFGVVHRGGAVYIVTGDTLSRFDGIDAVFAAYEYHHLDHDRNVGFVWGPVNPVAGLSFF